MLLHDVVHIPNSVSLAVIFAFLGGGVAVSLVAGRSSRGAEPVDALEDHADESANVPLASDPSLDDGSSRAASRLQTQRPSCQ